MLYIIFVIVGLMMLAIVPLIIFIRMLATYNVVQGCLAVFGFVGWFIFYPLLVFNSIRFVLAG